MKKKESFVEFLNQSKRRLRSLSMVSTSTADVSERDGCSSDEEGTTTEWTFNEEEELLSNMIQVLVGETDKVYVIVLRTIRQTTVNFKLKGQDLFIKGKLPSFPVVDGVVEWLNENFIPVRTKQNLISKKIHFDKEINPSNITKKKQGTTIFITIAKKK